MEVRRSFSAMAGTVCVQSCPGGYPEKQLRINQIPVSCADQAVYQVLEQSLCWYTRISRILNSSSSSHCSDNAVYGAGMNIIIELFSSSFRMMSTPLNGRPAR